MTRRTFRAGETFVAGPFGGSSVCAEGFGGFCSILRARLPFSPTGCPQDFEFLIEKHKNLLTPRLGCSGGISSSLCCGEHNTPWGSPTAWVAPDMGTTAPQPYPHSHPVPGPIPAPFLSFSQTNPSPVFTPTPFLDLFHPHSRPIPGPIQTPSTVPAQSYPWSHPISFSNPMSILILFLGPAHPIPNPGLTSALFPSPFPSHP